MTRPTRASCPLDLDSPGKRLGYLRVPYSSNRSAYGWIGVPIGVVRGGEGPTVYLGGGNHGDEYEGPITLLRLFQELEPSRVKGRLIFLPMTNPPAVLAYQRCSPIDGANLNRMFVGDPGLDHEPTKAIAHFVEEVLFPLCDAAIDLHSGGRTLDYVPSALARTGPEDPLRARKLAALRAFGAPVSYLVAPVGNDTGLLAAADRKGVLALGTELGGAGTVTPTTLAVARRGVLGFLAHLGLLDDVPAPGPTRIVEVRPEHYVYAPRAGLFEPAAMPGEEVAAGAVAGWLFDPDEPERAPLEVRFEAAGLVLCRRPIPLVERGDCLYHLGADLVG
ncbi:MAG: succinylglutamate desuccinylase/aspartoacylase family protein [Geminicoccaceae bacterium]|nr:succinylglutamate desuccinylase/aspartoacylase family protein [Geminicoccaceae bacterium]MDW8370475.1 succinylglutamate desuccinylase/aspartoacylase family protein [Geminicoccaceae bacterium]